MKATELLKTEVREIPQGSYSPSYFRFLGYREHLDQPIAFLRANGIASLFTVPKPVIFRNDLIVGNTHCLYTDAPETTVHFAEDFVKQIGDRTFVTNKDHFAPDYAHIVSVGIPGLIDEIDLSLQKNASDHKKCDTLQTMRITLSAFLQMIGNYTDAAKELPGKEGYDDKQLALIAENCSALLSGAPKSFAQGLQLIWLCHTAFCMDGCYAMALGRMDQYLYPLFKKDIDAEILSREEAIALLENVFIKIPPTDVVNICIGGMDRNGACQVNELSDCILSAVRNCQVPGPNLSARITPNTPDDFLLRCLESIGTGLGYPALMNDEVNVAALKRQGYEEDDVYSYCMVGCIENFLPGMQPPWSDGRFDAPRFFDNVFHRGVNAFHGSVGPDPGPVEEITSMDGFIKRFEAALHYGVLEYMAGFRARNGSIDQSYYPQPFLSCFCRDCISRGLDVNNGGSRYPSVHGAVLMGVGTVADSLAAIERVVFQERSATLAELRDAMDHDFEGYETLREHLLAAPKYGNNDDAADKYAVWFLDYLSAEFAKHRTRDSGAVYVAMAANVSNIYAGQHIGATPDGRKRGEPLSDAASPTYGRDRKGVTFTLSSVAKPDYTRAACGTVVNQKFMPSMFTPNRIKKLAALVRVYFRKGGQEIQINATSREVLTDAMEHPENYQDLVVRVSGFSAYFVTLDRAVQLDILNRTQQG